MTRGCRAGRPPLASTSLCPHLPSARYQSHRAGPEPSALAEPGGSSPTAARDGATSATSARARRARPRDPRRPGAAGGADTCGTGQGTFKAHRRAQLCCSLRSPRWGYRTHAGLGLELVTRALEQQAVSLGAPVGQTGPNADAGRVQRRRGLSSPGLQVPHWLQVPVQAQQVKAGYN